MVVIVAEIGCLARTALLTMRYGRPWVVFAGTMVGTAVTMAIAVIAGDLFHQRIPEPVLRWVSGAFFIALGFLIASAILLTIVALPSIRKKRDEAFAAEDA